MNSKWFGVRIINICALDIGKKHDTVVAGKDGIMAKRDIRFFVYGNQSFPVDHAYSLFVTLSRIWPQIHNDKFPISKDIGIRPIKGENIGNRQMRVSDGSYFVVRASDTYLDGLIRNLSQQFIRLGDTKLFIGRYQVMPISSCSVLYSPLVVISDAKEKESFLANVSLSLERLGIKANIRIPERKNKVSVDSGKKMVPGRELLRRTVYIGGEHKTTLAGYALEVKSLNDKDSVLLQEVGIGGRHKFGCGLFFPGKTS